ncbi:hypothetical protein D4764_02G0003720 [Takifugu flavidus]|uniref:Alkylated DNA repair protein AlkB homologue 8 N-terminal domain-containing protein n=1 Tax=Takifugu flavidus TaxID=433684 RepID=A0A5C6NL10_9TELE|nr:hypothetical protein D4764_02G0003720 [Takifugu flavidus]
MRMHSYQQTGQECVLQRDLTDYKFKPHDSVWGKDVPQEFKHWTDGEKVSISLFAVGVKEEITALRLSPFLFTTYTADFQYHSETCHLQKYSDDTVILNVTKTKEMVVDFSKSKSPPSPVCISGKEVEIVPSYRFLGVQLDNKLEWSTNTNAVYKKAMSRLYFLGRLRSFSCAGVQAKDANRLKLIKKAGSVVGCNLANLDEVVRDRMMLKFRTIMKNPSHTLHKTVDKLRSSFSNRLLQPRCSK